jgi:tRNA pseudouridine32 synthase/23S rRNA pseudouridine746 synthase
MAPPRPLVPAAVPTRSGVSPSTVALPSGPWPTVLDFLTVRLPKVSREDWAQRMAQGDVVDAQGLPVPPDAPFRPQTKLYYWRHLPFEHPVPFEAHIVFQDEWLLVADKPHFLPVTPKGRHLHETLLVRLKRQTGIDTLAPMHRIDLETAGLVAFTVQPHTRNAYQALFRDKQVHKRYQAIAPLAAGWAPGMQLRRQSHMADGDHFMTMREIAPQPDAPGQVPPPNADTHIQLDEVAHGLGLFTLSPVTGQRHQLRVHMNALGMPLCGDRIYPVLMPTPPADQAPDHSRPLQLLAQHMAFDDPITGQARAFTSSRQLSLDAVADWPPAPVSPHQA